MDENSANLFIRAAWCATAWVGMIRLTNVLHMFAQAAMVKVSVENDRIEAEAKFFNGDDPAVPEQRGGAE